MSDLHNIPRTSLNKPIANQGFVDPNLGNQNLGGLSRGIQAAENLLHGGQLGGGQILGGQQLGGQQYLGGQQLGQQHLGQQLLGQALGGQHLGGQQLLGGQHLGGQNLGGQILLEGQQLLGQQHLGQQHLSGQQFVAGQQMLGQPHLAQGQTTVSQQTTMAAANLPSKIITIEEKPAVITTVTTSQAPVQVETQTNLVQETVQSMRQEIVQPVVQPVVEMKEEVIGMQPIIGQVPVTTGYVETGYVQNQGFAGQGGSIISSNINTIPIGVTDTYSTGAIGHTGLMSTGPLHSGLNQPINTGLHGAPVVHEKKKRGLFHRKPKDTNYGENRYV